MDPKYLSLIKARVKEVIYLCVYRSLHSKIRRQRLLSGRARDRTQIIAGLVVIVYCDNAPICNDRVIRFIWLLHARITHCTTVCGILFYTFLGLPPSPVNSLKQPNLCVHFSQIGPWAAFLPLLLSLIQGSSSIISFQKIMGFDFHPTIKLPCSAPWHLYTFQHKYSTTISWLSIHTQTKLPHAKRHSVLSSPGSQLSPLFTILCLQLSRPTMLVIRDVWLGRH